MRYLIMKSKIVWNKLIISILICFSAAYIGSAATTPKIQSWYATLEKPFFSPPNWVFGPVWTILYLLMAIALYQVWVKKNNLTDKAFYWFWAQLILNSLWSWMFFGWEQLGLAIIVIAALWYSIYKTIKNFKYQLPYLCWVSFATLLNIGVWWLNR